MDVAFFLAAVAALYTAGMEYSWDAATYDSLELPHLRWGNQLLNKFRFHGNETVMDAGCGPGRDTAKLASLARSGKVIALDSSEAMLSLARSNLSGSFANVEFRLQDLREPFSFQESCDLVFSVAALHWIHGHQRVFANFAKVLRPRGVFLADCGGDGNIASIREVISARLGATDADLVWNFQDVDSTEANLGRAGFSVRDVHLEEDPATFQSDSEFREFITTLILGAHLPLIPEEDRDDFVSDVVNDLGSRVVDYVRLKIDAIRL